MKSFALRQVTLVTELAGETPSKTRPDSHSGPERAQWRI